MQKIQLYIEGQRVDMFDDESVVITQTIKNVQDVGKIFTDFTRTFSLPASKTNNKIFKHYYNYHIQNGFDARTRKPANIELNTLPFTDGRVKLEGVDLKDNKPHTYKITFFGSTVTLKDLVGDDTLSILSSLTSLNKLYDATNIKASLQADPTTSDIIAPLITHTQRLTFNSHNSANQVGNIAWNIGHVHGVLYSELKYAIRLHTIVEAIETQYGITFSNDFFVNTNTPYYNLFMWLHRKKGDVENLSNENQSIVNGFTPEADNTTTQTHLKSNTTLEIYGDPQRYDNITELRFVTSSTVPYSISLQKDGVEVVRFNDVVGNQVINQFTFDGDYTIYIESSADITFTKIEWYISYEQNVKTYSTGSYLHSDAFTFDITQQIPEMKVIDFLSGLFKTFNLTAYVEQNTNEIVVKDLNSFYSGGSSYDVTKYIDVSKSQVNIALPYREINFQHEDTKTFLASIHSQKFGKTWGKSEYTNSEKLDGTIYDIKTPFSQMKYERLVDENAAAITSTTTVQVGYFVDDNQESYFGKPLIFYPIRQTSANGIAFLSSPTSQEELTTYNIPSNSVALTTTASTYNINFYEEVNEYTRETGFTNTLFKAYYSDYITSVFNPTNRITKVSAYLPLRILLNYTLADRFVIGANSYKINSIKTNLKNGKSDIELLNDL
jgi:hypothetical protein